MRGLPARADPPPEAAHFAACRHGTPLVLQAAVAYHSGLRSRLAAADYRPLLQLQLPAGPVDLRSRQVLAQLHSLTAEGLQLVEAHQTLQRRCQVLLALLQHLKADLQGA